MDAIKFDPTALQAMVLGCIGGLAAGAAFAGQWDIVHDVLMALLGALALHRLTVPQP